MKKTSLPTSKAKTAYALLSEVRRLILAEPLRYDQTQFIARKDELGYAPGGFPSCGTVGCVAGWVATLKQGTDFSYEEAEDMASSILGLAIEQSDELFDGDALSCYGPLPRRQTLAYAELGAKHIAIFQKKYAAQLKAKRV